MYNKSEKRLILQILRCISFDGKCSLFDSDDRRDDRVRIIEEKRTRLLVRWINRSYTGHCVLTNQSSFMYLMVVPTPIAPLESLFEHESKLTFRVK